MMMEYNNYDDYEPRADIRREKQNLFGLERQVYDMLADTSLDSRRICKELDCHVRYSNPERLAVVGVLLKIKNNGLATTGTTDATSNTDATVVDMKKLQLVINHYVIAILNIKKIFDHLGSSV
jgi:hypothetical protein